MRKTNLRVAVSASPIASLATNATQLLRTSADTIDNRAAGRDVEQERSMARTVAIFKAATGVELTELEGWKFMQALKMARSFAGFNIDDYIDGAAYAALAGECAAREGK